MIWGFVIPIALIIYMIEVNAISLLTNVYLAFVLFLLQSYSLLSSNNSGVVMYFKEVVIYLTTRDFTVP